MHWKSYDEAVDLVERGFSFFPQAFRWRGRRYEAKRSSGHGRPHVRAGAAISGYSVRRAFFDLYQDLTASTWHIRRVRWGGRAVTVAVDGRQEAEILGV